MCFQVINYLTDLISLFGESIDDVLSDEAGSAEDGDDIASERASSSSTALDLLQRIRLGARLLLLLHNRG